MGFVPEYEIKNFHYSSIFIRGIINLKTGIGLESLRRWNWELLA
jgi:hypothetical protein